MRHGVWPKRSAPFRAKRLESSSCSSPRMLTAKVPARSMRGQVDEVCATQKRMSGGSSDSDVKEFAAMPDRFVVVDRGDDGDAGGEVPEDRPEPCVVGDEHGLGGFVGHGLLLGQRSRRTQLVTEAVGGGEHLGPADAGRQLAGVAQDGVEAVVAVRRTVVEQAPAAARPLPWRRGSRTRWCSDPTCA